MSLAPCIDTPDCKNSLLVGHQPPLLPFCLLLDMLQEPDIPCVSSQTVPEQPEEAENFEPKHHIRDR